MMVNGKEILSHLHKIDVEIRRIATLLNNFKYGWIYDLMTVVSNKNMHVMTDRVEASLFMQ